MRLFVALEIPVAVRNTISTLISDFRELAPEVRWARPESLHVTLRFIGEVEPEKVGAIRVALGGATFREQVALGFRGIHFFLSKRFLVLWVGLEDSAELQSLASHVDRKLIAVGIPREERVYTPHVTLARSNNPEIITKLRPVIDQNSQRNFGSFQATQFHLIESKLKASGAEYTTLQSFVFAAEA